MTKHRYSKIAATADETPEKLREEFPDSLVKAYVALKNSNFADLEHEKYVKLALKFLGGLASDPIEVVKLGVRLTRATYDLVDKKYEKEEKVKKASAKKA